MKKILSIWLTLFLIFSTFLVFSPKVKAQETPEQLTTNPYKDGHPSWSPDGTKITYTAFSGSWYRHIWVMNSDGSGKTQLTFGSVADSYPVFSPDGTKIVFARHGFRGDRFDLMLMNADGTGIIRLTDGGIPGMVEGTYEELDWSKDGSKLLFSYGEGTTGQYKPWWVCTVDFVAGDIDEGDIDPLIRGFNPVFCYDDTKILFTHSIDPYFGDMRIAMMNVDGTGLEDYLSSGPVDYEPDMSPLNDRIVFTRGGEVGDLYLMDADGSSLDLLLSNGERNYMASWSPDGEYIAYASGIVGVDYDIWKIEAPIAVRAWKDESSLGLENEHLLLHGSAVTGNYRWFFDYLIFKDTGTKWYQPWGELAIIVYPIGSLGPWVTGDYEINAFTEADKAYLTYSVTQDNLRQDVTYTIYPSEPYIHITFSTTNIGSTIENTWAGVQFTTWIAGDYGPGYNDYYYVPGYGERRFAGNTGYTYYTDATEMWVATWDQNKGEGAGMLSTKGFDPSNIISIDFGGSTGEGFRFTSDSFNLAPGQTSETYDCYLYFFTGTGWQKTKEFYDSLAPPVEDTEAYIEYVNGTVQDLPDEIFNKTAEDVPDVKNDFSDLFDDALENIDEGNYEAAIEKLNSIKEGIHEDIMESDERQQLIDLIDNLIAYLETLI